MTSHSNASSSPVAAASLASSFGSSVAPMTSTGEFAAASPSALSSSSLAAASSASSPPLPVSSLEPSPAEFSLLWNRYAWLRQVVQLCRQSEARSILAVGSSSAVAVGAPAEKALWREVRDPVSGKRYWYNHVTRETTWNNPIPAATATPALADAANRNAVQSTLAAVMDCPTPAPSALPPLPALSKVPRSYSPQISSLFPVQPRFIECWAARQKQVEAELYPIAAAGHKLSAAAASAAVPAPLDRLPTLRDVFQTHNDTLGLLYVPTDLLKIIAGYAVRHPQFERKAVGAVVVWKHTPRAEFGQYPQQPPAPPIMIARFDSEQAFRMHVVRTVVEPSRVADFLSGWELAGEEAGRQFDSDRAAAAARTTPSAADGSASSSSSSSSFSSPSSSSPPVASVSWSLDDDRARYVSQARSAFVTQFRRANPCFVRLTRGRGARESALEWIKLERPSTPLRQVGLQYEIAVPLLEQPLNVQRAEVDAKHRNIAVEIVFVED